MQTSLVERTDGNTAIFDPVEDVSAADSGALILRGYNFTTVFAAGVWATVTTVPSDTEEAVMLRQAYAAQPLRSVA